MRAQVGDTVEMRGPTGRFNFRKLLPPLKNLALVCGGTGLTPMLQLLRCVLADRATCPATNVQLLMQYREERDILCADDLESILTTHPKRVKMSVALSRPPSLSSPPSRNSAIVTNFSGASTYSGRKQ